MPDLNQSNPLVLNYLNKMLSGGLSMQTSTVSESIPITILTLPELHLGQKITDEYPNFNIVGEIDAKAKHKWRIGKRQ
jgi:hypothetical protein